MKPLGALSVLAGMMLVLSLVVERTGWRLFAGYSALGFLACAVAYAFRWPAFWQKRANGTLHPLSYVLLGPLHILNWLSLVLAIGLRRVEALHEIAPNVWLGRRVLPHELAALPNSKSFAVLDLTSEFAENRTLRRRDYLCIPVLDHTAPTAEQTSEALAFLDKRAPHTPVFVHCALGHGRGATVVAAWLLKHKQSPGVEAAVRHLQRIRSGVRLGTSQLKLLEEMFPKPVVT